jgi:MFS family permease
VSGPTGEPRPSRAYANYVLAMLTLMYAFNYLDRYVLSMLIEPIKRELALSDSALGFLSGPAFAVIYASLGIPIARLADRGSRRLILALSFAAWSAFTVLSGWARSGLELTAARIGVGIGEAGGTAPAHSLLSDYFPASVRARALAIFQTGVYLGQFMGIYAGGILAVEIGWRMTFVAAGAPGLLLALLLFASVREPARERLDAARDSGPERGLREGLRALWRLGSFRWLMLGGGIASFAGTGFGTWIPTLFVRVHDMTLAEVGRTYAWYNVPATLVGTLGAGWLADRLAQRDPRWLLRVPVISLVLSLPFLLGVALLRDAQLALLCAIPSGLLGAGWAPPVYGAAQNLVPPQMRAFAASLLVLSLTLLGQGAGPQIVGLLNDGLAARFGEDAIRWSLAIVLTTTLVGAAMIAWAARSFARDLEALRGSAAR